MDRSVTAFLVLALLGVLLGMLWVSWRSRRRRQAGLPAPAAIPEGFAAERVEGMHMATTVGGAPLDRVAVRGLGFRARGDLAVAASGIALRLDGGTEAFVPSTDVRGAGRATWTIDKTVEPDGLVVIGWRLGDAELDTYLRVDDPAALVAAVDAIASPGTPGRPTSPATPGPEHTEGSDAA